MLSGLSLHSVCYPVLAVNTFITWPAQARALSKYNLVILNAGVRSGGAQHQKWEVQALSLI